MQRANIKAVLIAIAASLVLYLGVTMLSAFCMVEIYNDVAPQLAVGDSSAVLRHPLFIALTLLTATIVVGIPAYLAAILASVSRVGAAVTVGVFWSLWTLVSATLSPDPLWPAAGAIVALYMTIAWLVGKFAVRSNEALERSRGAAH